MGVVFFYSIFAMIFKLDLVEIFIAPKGEWIYPLCTCSYAQQVISTNMKFPSNDHFC